MCRVMCGSCADHVRPDFGAVKKINILCFGGLLESQFLSNSAGLPDGKVLPGGCSVKVAGHGALKR